MKRTILSIFSIFILIALPLQAIEIDKSMFNDISKEISNKLSVPTIVGDDDRQEITGKASKLEKAVVVIELKGNVICSGALVAPNIVLTAAHCLTDDKGNYERGARVYAIGVKVPKVEKNNIEHVTTGINNWSFHTYPLAISKQLWIPDEFKQAISSNDIHKEQRYDYGIIVLDHNLGYMTEGWLGLKILSNEELEYANIIAIGRGGDKRDRTLWKSPGKIKEILIDDVIFHDADILGGNSGGPILKEEDPTNIVALANWQYKEKHVEDGYPNMALRIRQEIVDAVEIVANGGTLPGMKTIKNSIFLNTPW